MDLGFPMKTQTDLIPALHVSSYRRLRRNSARIADCFKLLVLPRCPMTGESNRGTNAQLGSPARGRETFSGIIPRDVPEGLRHGEELGIRGSNLSSGYRQSDPRPDTRRPSSPCTRRRDEIYADGFSSSSLAGTDSGEEEAAAAAAL
ncbi:hypothetical protein F511_19075 [Dorcoceras hygrometricum]|uniref:Uncharacterized protein n=1 Tax=Dorcoceras hygrometricum TaxID=472368 RepID=A0A2Z7ACX6_9LAMI|nr:hypothetical protein F511_19075 [Dorcoceras hygrometricum]